MNRHGYTTGRYPAWLPGAACAGLLLLLLVGIHYLPHLAHAQGPDQQLGLEIEKTLDGSEVVQVGQVLQFTIRIRNTGTLSITHLVVEDTFDESIVVPSGEGEFAEADDPAHSTPLGTLSGSTITWDDLVENLPDQALNPDEEMTIKVRLRAVHPTDDLQIVNQAAIKEAIREGGKRESGVDTGASGNVGGSNAPVTKSASSQTIGVGTLITYTIRVENDSLIPLNTIPLRDTYNPAALQFLRAVPPASSHNQASGTLEWSDLLAITGQDELLPGESVEVMTVYRALQPMDSAPNEAEVYGARDHYGNELTPRQAQAPIRIVAAATATAVSTRTPTAQATTTSVATETPSGATSTATQVPLQPRDDDDDDDDDDQEATTTPTIAATIEQIATMTQGDVTVTPTAVDATATPETPQFVPTSPTDLPRDLPRTGSEEEEIVVVATPLVEMPRALPRTAQGSAGNGLLLLPVVVVLVVVGAVLMRRSRQP